MSLFVEVLVSKRSENLAEDAKLNQQSQRIRTYQKTPNTSIVISTFSFLQQLKKLRVGRGLESENLAANFATFKKNAILPQKKATKTFSSREPREETFQNLAFQQLIDLFNQRRAHFVAQISDNLPINGTNFLFKQ